ncbi:unnamed protein product [Pleuronectes platessa]|uniref:Uncharacterized protein n=1 Tax=Pleuronectes platessa TaxID=8262 RepID=A0A9N7TIU2_PLEPL|nr:unnamed protein product [Pleuronectes platessa]
MQGQGSAGSVQLLLGGGGGGGGGGGEEEDLQQRYRSPSGLLLGSVDGGSVKDVSLSSLPPLSSSSLGSPRRSQVRSDMSFQRVLGLPGIPWEPPTEGLQDASCPHVYTTSCQRHIGRGAADSRPAAGSCPPGAVECGFIYLLFNLASELKTHCPPVCRRSPPTGNQTPNPSDRLFMPRPLKPPRCCAADGGLQSRREPMSSSETVELDLMTTILKIKREAACEDLFIDQQLK